MAPSAPLRPKVARSLSLSLLVAAGGLIAASCGGEGTKAEADAPTPTRAKEEAPSSSQPPETSSPDPLVEDFVMRCAEYVSFKLQIGDGPYVAVWGHLDNSGIQGECRRVVTTDPAITAAIEVEIVQLKQYFDGVAANDPTTTQPAPPPPSPPPPPPPPPTTAARARGGSPTIQLNCGHPGNGDYEWLHVTYGYATRSSEPLVEWGMDYGDGNNYVAHNEAEARADLYWQKYYSPGTYLATAWVVDSFGRRGDATCTFVWYQRTSGGRSDDDYTDSGDLDCDDIGEPVYVGDDDPNNLDGDGDGWGCEAW